MLATSGFDFTAWVDEGAWKNLIFVGCIGVADPQGVVGRMALHGTWNDVGENVTSLSSCAIGGLEQAPYALFCIIAIQLGETKFETDERATKNAIDFKGDGMVAWGVVAQVFF